MKTTGKVAHARQSPVSEAASSNMWEVDSWNGKPLEQCTREELIEAVRAARRHRFGGPNSMAYRQSLVERDRIILETLASHTRQETADRLGLSYQIVTKIAKGAGVPRAPMKSQRADISELLASVRVNGMAATGRVFGISRERVRQIVVRHENATREVIKRKKRKPESGASPSSKKKPSNAKRRIEHPPYIGRTSEELEELLPNDYEPAADINKLKSALNFSKHKKRGQDRNSNIRHVKDLVERAQRQRNT